MNELHHLSRFPHTFTLLLVLVSSAQETPKQQSVALHEARKLVFLALPKLTANAPGFELDEYKDEYFPDFFFFEALWDNPNAGSVVAGHYAVDRRTGEVWEPMSCARITSAAIRKY